MLFHSRTTKRKDNSMFHVHQSINENRILSKYPQLETVSPQQLTAPRLLHVPSSKPLVKDPKLLHVHCEKFQKNQEPLKLLSIRKKYVNQRADVLLRVPTSHTTRIFSMNQENQTEKLSLKDPTYVRTLDSQCQTANLDEVKIVEQPTTNGTNHPIEEEIANIEENTRYGTSSFNFNELSTAVDTISTYVSKIHTYVEQMEDLRPLCEIADKKDEDRDSGPESPQQMQSDHSEQSVIDHSPQSERSSNELTLVQQKIRLMEETEFEESKCNSSKIPRALKMGEMDFRQYLERHGLFLSLMPETSKAVKACDHETVISVASSTHTYPSEEEPSSLSSSLAIADIFTTPNEEEQISDLATKSVLRNKLAQFMNQKGPKIATNK